MKRLQKKLILLLITLTAGVIFGQLSINTQLPSLQNKLITPSPKPTLANVLPAYIQTAIVTKVIDGDTIEIDTGQKIRYIGIDTPETQHPTKGLECFGQEAKAKNKELIEGRRVRLIRDVSETDRYGRLLRYVYLTDITPSASSEGFFVNEYLVKEGYAYAATFPPDIKYNDYFKKLQDQAMQDKKGLWSACR